MSELKTPIKDFIADLKAVLTAEPELAGVVVYDHWLPKTGAKLPCISLVEIGGEKQKEAGIGQRISSTELGVFVPVTVQVDVWARSVSSIRDIADKARYALWKNRGSFGDKSLNLIVSSDVWRSQETIRVKEEIYRKMFTAQAVYAMTQTA